MGRHSRLHVRPLETGACTESLRSARPSSAGRRVEVQKTSYLRRRQSDNRQWISHLQRQPTSTEARFETICVHTFVHRTNKVAIFEGFWRRRPDLNRGWRLRI